MRKTEENAPSAFFSFGGISRVCHAHAALANPLVKIISSGIKSIFDKLFFMALPAKFRTRQRWEAALES